ncbi:MAG: hypothetical protein LWX83_06955 [Anaerolineae bacterium]|nr:hypothetical protein [Anaerolineae bacterium]
MTNCRPFFYLLVLLTGLFFIGCIPARPSQTLTSSIIPTPTPDFSYLINSTPTSQLNQPPKDENSTGKLPGCSESSGRVLPYHIENGSFNFPIQGRIYLPPCYNSKPSTPYPYIIMLHGKLFTDDQWERLGLTRAADRLIAEGAIPPLIIVMPLEYETSSDPLSSDFGAAIVQQVLPWLKENYPVGSDRRCHAIGGLSRGAFWAYRIGMLNWSEFGVIGGHSLPNTQFTEYFLRDLVKSIPPDEMPRLYLDSGDRDIALKEVTAFEALLVKFKIAHTWQIYSGDHSESYWSAHVDDYLRWYATPWNLSCSQAAAQ